MPKVFIVHDNGEYGDMYRSAGWKLAEYLDEAHLVQFTGGADVTPSFYGHQQHKKTQCNPYRDAKEKLVYLAAQGKGIPCTGICRGGQFLNVMNGGTMWQDVNNHARFNGHEIVDLKTGEVFTGTSTHHQMFNPGIRAEIIAVAFLSTMKEEVTGEYVTTRYINRSADNIARMADPDMEVIFYEDTKSFCFQPHPEFPGQVKLAERYFDYLDRYPLAA